MRLIFIFILTIASLNVSAQGTYNQFDADGKRHGNWRKFFHNTKELRYEGQFNHGKEIDTFKFYTLNKGKSVLSAIKVFTPDSDEATVTFLSSKGKIISQGQMFGKLYVGKWTYYHNKSDAIMSEENYNNNGQLDGEKLVYYPDGTKAEKSNYTNGKLNGSSIWYAKTGKILKDFTYENDELHGLSKYYDAEGHLQAEGTYRKGLKHGIWNYYENGKFVKSKDHTKRSKNPNPKQ